MRWNELTGHQFAEAVKACGGVCADTAAKQLQDEFYDERRQPYVISR